jgi:hypothetical protein
MRLPLHLETIGTPAVLHFTTGDASIEVRVEPDPEAQPFWLGRFVTRRRPGTVRAGRNGWFLPAVSIAEMEEAAALCYGHRHARRAVHERLQEDLRRLSEYGRTWTLYRMTVAVSRQGQALGSETVSGLAEHDMPFTGAGFGTLVERLAGDVLERRL